MRDATGGARANTVGLVTEQIVVRPTLDAPSPEAEQTLAGWGTGIHIGGNRVIPSLGLMIPPALPRPAGRAARRQRAPGAAGHESVANGWRGDCSP